MSPSVHVVGHPSMASQPQPRRHHCGRSHFYTSVSALQYPPSFPDSSDLCPQPEVSTAGCHPTPGNLPQRQLFFSRSGLSEAPSPAASKPGTQEQTTLCTTGGPRSEHSTLCSTRVPRWEQTTLCSTRGPRWEQNTLCSTGIPSRRAYTFLSSVGNRASEPLWVSG